MSTPARRRLMRDFKVCYSPLFFFFLVINTKLSKTNKQELKLLINTFFFQKRMQQDPPSGVSASPLPDNVMKWYV